MRQIVMFPHKILRIKTENISVVDKKILNEVNELKKILMAAENGAGLAATQIGLDRRFFGTKDHQSNKINIYFNPKIEKSFGKKDWIFIETASAKATAVKEDFLEGCLSFPGLWGTVKRFMKIRVSWDELVGKELVRRDADLSGFDAIVWQHELDHLNGIVFVDRVKEDGGKFYKTVGKEMEVMNVDEILNKEK